FDALAAKLAGLGGELLVRAFDLAAAGELRFEEQGEEGVTYAEKIDPVERRLDPGRPAAELARAVRALAPHVGVYLEAADGERLGVKRADDVDIDLAPGDVELEDGALLVGCDGGSLRLLEVQPPGGKPMPVDAYLRGHAPPRLARPEL
ncbi:MAG TPA: methionyl-tRNA formyltransferase, partial [Solirubrobacterales bacterium]